VLKGSEYTSSAELRSGEKLTIDDGWTPVKSSFARIDRHRAWLILSIVVDPGGLLQILLSRCIVYSILLHSTATLPAMCIGEGELLC
jgi:hypothetical protein